MGCVAYADDVCLMVLSSLAVRKMLTLCVDFGQEYNVKFNSSKSQLTVCSKDNIVVDDNFNLNGDIINK